MPTGLYLTDLGETMGYLADHGISPRQSPKRRKIVHDVLSSQGVDVFRGELRAPLEDWDKAAWTVTRLSQAIVQISDLVFSLRLSVLSTFKEEVEEYWIESRIPYDSRGYANTLVSRVVRTWHDLIRFLRKALGVEKIVRGEKPCIPQPAL